MKRAVSDNDRTNTPATMAVACRVGVLSGAGTREALEPIADCVIASIAILDAVLRPLLAPKAPAADGRACARSAR